MLCFNFSWRVLPRSFSQYLQPILIFFCTLSHASLGILFLKNKFPTYTQILSSCLLCSCSICLLKVPTIIKIRGQRKQLLLQMTFLNGLIDASLKSTGLCPLIPKMWVEHGSDRIQNAPVPRVAPIGPIMDKFTKCNNLFKFILPI